MQIANDGRQSLSNDLFCSNTKTSSVTYIFLCKKEDNAPFSITGLQWCTPSWWKQSNQWRQKCLHLNMARGTQENMHFLFLHPTTPGKTLAHIIRDSVYYLQQYFVDKNLTIGNKVVVKIIIKWSFLPSLCPVGVKPAWASHRPCQTGPGHQAPLPPPGHPPSAGDAWWRGRSLPYPPTAVSARFAELGFHLPPPRCRAAPLLSRENEHLRRHIVWVPVADGGNYTLCEIIDVRPMRR